MAQKFLNGIEISGNLTVDSNSAIGTTVLDIQGTQGQLFSVTNSLTGDLFSVSDISGIPILTVNSSGAVTIDGTLQSDGNITLSGGALSISGDGSNAVTLTESGSGDFTIDAPDDIRLDAGGGDVVLRTGGTEFGRISSYSNNLRLTSSATNADIVLTPNGTGKVNITAELEATSLDINGVADISGVTTIGPGTTGTPYDATTFLHVKGTTRSILQQSSTADAYYMFGDASANNVAWLGYNHNNGTMEIHAETAVTIDKPTTITGNITALTGASSGNITVGRNTNEKTVIHVGDQVNSITAYQDSDGNATHNFVLNRAFGGTGANDFIIQKDGTAQFTLDTSANATFAGGVTVAGDLTVNGTTTTINTATVEVEDNILQLNTTQGSPDTATAATSGISIYRGNGVTQASLIFDDADDTWDLTNRLIVAGTVVASNFSGTHSGSSSGTNTGDQVLPTLSSLGGASNVFLTNTGGAKLEIQNATDGTSAKGIYMWSTDDSNWGIYMSQAGTGKALNDGEAAAGIDGRTGHAIRFRVNDSTTQIGFLWENSSQEALMQLQADTGKLFTRGAIYPSNQTTNYVDSTRIANWQSAYGWGDHGLSAQDKTDIGNLSGTNTGDTSVTDSISTTSSTTRASATAAKAAYDRGSTGIADASTAQTTANAALPKAGGTMTGDIVMQDEMVNFAAGNPELPNFRGKRSNTDLNDRQWDTEGGWSYTTFESNTTNKPSTGLHNGNGLLSFNTHAGDGTNNYFHQIAMTTNTNKLWHRRMSGSSFGSWEEIFKGSVPYSSVTGTPTIPTDFVSAASGGTFDGNVRLATTNATSYTNINADASGLYIETAGSTAALSDMRIQARSAGAGNYASIAIKPSNQSVLLRTNSTTALTLDSSQNATFAGQVIIQDNTSQPLSNLFEGTLVVQGSPNEDPIIAVTDVNTANAAAGVFHQSSTSPGFPALVINAASNGSEQPLISARTNVSNTTGIGGTEVFAVDGDGDATFAGTISASGYNDTNWNTAYSWGDHGLSAQDKTDIGNLSGINTGDQDLSGYLTASSTQTKYLRSDAADTASSEILFDAGFKSDSVLLSGSQNFDNISRSGFYNLYNTSSGSTNPPTGHTYGTMIVVGGNKQNSSFGMQLAHQRTGGAGQLKVRGMNDTASAWSSWNTVYTSADVIPSAVLDADTAHLSTTQTFTGAKTFTGTVALTGTGRITGVDTVSATTDAANKGYVDDSITDLIGGAPAALDTLNELAAAINDDASYASTLTTALTTKLPLAGGTLTGTLTGTYGIFGNHLYVNQSANLTSQALQVNGFIDITDVTSTALRWYNGSTFKGGLGLDDWAHTGSASDITMYISGDNSFHISTNNVKRVEVDSSGIAVTGVVTATGGNSTEWNTAYDKTLQWDGSATALVAATGRASLGLGTAATTASTAYWPTSGSWWASNMPGSRARGMADNGGEVVILQDNPSTARSSILVDGQYYAGENGGFYSLYSGNNYNSKVGFYGNSSGHFYITTADVKANGNTVWHAGNDGTTSGLDADLLDGYHLSTTRNAANTVPVRDANGYANFGWINTTSGATTATINKIYVSDDNYIRYITPANFGAQIGAHVSYNDIADRPYIVTASTTSATTTTTIANVVHATYTAAFFDFVIKNGTNVRAGVVYACHDGTDVEYTETSTHDLGDTSDVTLSVDISGTNMRLLATTTSSTWTIKSLIRAI